MNAKFFFHFGRYLILLKSAFARPQKWSMIWKEIVRQMYDIGIGSLVIVSLISIFIGAVTAVQFAYQLRDSLLPKYYIGYIVRDITIIELAPTITCLVLAGKVGANMAAEIGGMRQKEHIDAMEVMGVNTSSFLIFPKIIAAITMIPMLVTIGATVSMVGGYLSSVPTGTITGEEYVRGLRVYFLSYNIFMMLVKSFVFAFLLTTVSCYQGYYVKGGSIELGRASTQAVVFSDILILLSDLVIALVLTA
ncbi:MAG: ABC transporter permease [Saprospiraceae bacterium]|nr:ABC transporter permease [Saprospiraceae bacterium]